MPTGAIPDEESRIIEAARRDPSAFAPLYDAHVESIYRYCYRRVGHRAEAMDLTAHVFTRALERLETYRPRSGAGFRAWLFAIARNTIADEWRRKRPVALDDETALTLRDTSPDPESVAIHRTEMDELRLILLALPERQRGIVELRLAGLNTAEIAVAMGMSVAAVKSAQTRAYAYIRTQMQPREEAGL